MSLLGGSLGLRASFPPSVAYRRHLPPRGTAFSGSCFAVAGIGALVVGQSIFESEFPPSVACRRHLPPRGTAFSGSCFAVAGVGALVVGQSWFESESPLSVPLGHLSPKEFFDEYCSVYK